MYFLKTLRSLTEKKDTPRKGDERKKKKKKLN